MRWYGETDTKTGVIKINKKLHKTNPTHRKRYAELADTLKHELTHAQHPKMLEKDVRKKTTQWIKNTTTKQKKKLYSVLK